VRSNSRKSVSYPSANSSPVSARRHVKRSTAAAPLSRSSPPAARRSASSARAPDIRHHYHARIHPPEGAPMLRRTLTLVLTSLVFTSTAEAGALNPWGLPGGEGVFGIN